MASDADDEALGVRLIAVSAEAAGGRVDKTLANLLPDLSRARLQALIADGRVSYQGVSLSDVSAPAAAGDYRVEIPPPVAAEPAPEAIALTVLYEDADLIVVDKPPGMAVHPAPGSETGTLV